MKSLTPRLWLSLLGAGIGITAIVVAVLLLDGDTPGESPSPSLTEPAPESSVAPAPVAAPLPTTEPSIPPSAAAPDPGEEVVIPTPEEDAPTPPEPPEEDAPTPPEQPAEPTPEQPTAPDQPLAPSSPSPSGYAVTDLLHSDRLGFVLGFESFPNGDGEVALVAREGHLWRWDTGRGDEPTLFADISDRVHAGGEEGLLGLAFSPAYPSDRRLYLYYSAAGPRRSVLSRFTVVGETVDAASEEILLEVAQPFANHNGGQLTFGPDGMLYLALGDGGSGGDPLGHGQNLTTLLGSILRLHVSAPGPYRIPLDNPFVDLPGAQPEIFAHGLRNPWRFSFDSAPAPFGPATSAKVRGKRSTGSWPAELRLEHPGGLRLLYDARLRPHRPATATRRLRPRRPRRLFDHRRLRLPGTGAARTRRLVPLRRPLQRSPLGAQHRRRQRAHSAAGRSRRLPSDLRRAARRGIGRRHESTAGRPSAAWNAARPERGSARLRVATTRARGVPLRRALEQRLPRLLHAARQRPAHQRLRPLRHPDQCAQIHPVSIPICSSM